MKPPKSRYTFLHVPTGQQYVQESSRTGADGAIIARKSLRLKHNFGHGTLKLIATEKLNDHHPVR